jgi:uncharacterized membrane protein YkvA (DUF1232 family)
MKSYCDFLREELDNFEGDFDKFIFYIPDFFKLLCNLLDEDIKPEDRRKINSALAYFVTPNDVISDEIYGPMGYVDDIYLCTVVLKEIQEKYGFDLLNKLWSHDEDLDYVLEYSYNKSYQILEEQNLVDEVLRYSGLK